MGRCIGVVPAFYLRGCFIWILQDRSRRSFAGGFGWLPQGHQSYADLCRFVAKPVAGSCSAVLWADEFDPAVFR